MLFDRNSEIIRLRKEGNSYAQVGKTFGLTRQRVHKILKKYDLSGRIENLKRKPRKRKLCVHCNEEKVGVLFKKKHGFVCPDCYQKVKLPIKLPEGKWAWKFDQCIDCGTTERKNQGDGRCSNCYVRWYYRTHESYRISQKESNKTPKAKNYFRKYNKEHPKKYNPKKYNREYFRKYYLENRVRLLAYYKEKHRLKKEQKRFDI